MTDPLHVSEQDWSRVETLKERADSYLTEPHLCNITVACCLVELRDRVEALEAMAKTAALLVHEAGPTLALSEDAFQALDAPPVPAPAGVSVDELADCLPANAWPESGVVRQAFARHLLDHPRIGPLLRGEGAAAPKRVVLPEKPPMTGLYWVGHDYRDGYRDCWAAARAEVERQQQGGQADG